MSIELLNVDCMGYMSTLPDKAFDICITSPPYNMNLRVRNGSYCSRQIIQEISTKYSNYKDNLSMGSYFDFLNKSVEEMIRVSALTFLNLQILTGNKPAVFKMLGDHSEHIKELIIWDKCFSQPAIRDNVLNSRFELIIVFSRDATARRFYTANFKRGDIENLWEIRKERSKDKSHKATFPEALTDRILSLFSKKGMKVFDPFMGTGTTGISAHRFSCDFVGCEIDKKYYDNACKRIKEETRQLDMFREIQEKEPEQVDLWA